MEAVERKDWEQAVRLDVPEESEAQVERRARAAWEFRERVEVLEKQEVRLAWTLPEEERARLVAGPEREELWWRGGFRVRECGFLACADL
jgi:hypothetical protein